jgi:hypothetical protein
VRYIAWAGDNRVEVEDLATTVRLTLHPPYQLKWVTGDRGVYSRLVEPEGTLALFHFYTLADAMTFAREKYEVGLLAWRKGE